MPDLGFQIIGVEAAARGLAPLLHFKLRITAKPETDAIQAIILQAQIQIQPTQRHYAGGEKEKLVELFGMPHRWGQALRSRLWANVGASVGQFTGSVTAVLPVPCTYDLNMAATKYFYALGGGDVPLLFLFSGTIFHNVEGKLQVERISWDKACAWRMPVGTWKGMMRQHYRDGAWIPLQGDAFEEIYAYKRNMGFATWEETVRQLLSEAEKNATIAFHEPVTG